MSKQLVIILIVAVLGWFFLLSFKFWIGLGVGLSLGFWEGLPIGRASK